MVAAGSRGSQVRFGWVPAAIATTMVSPMAREVARMQAATMPEVAAGVTTRMAVWKREGSYAMGATRFQTAIRVVTPAAISGIVAAYILGISRAVGETMIVAVAAGTQPNLTWNPLEGAATITAYIVQVSLGDLPHGSLEYQSIFAVGLVLLMMTLLFNVIGHLLRRRFRERY